MNPYQKVAQILRAEEGNIKKLCQSMDSFCNTSGVLARIIAENDFRVKEILSILGLSRKSSNREVYQALINKLKEDDRLLFEALEKPRCTSPADCRATFTVAKKLVGNYQGFFLKHAKMAEMLQECPPPRMMEALGYDQVDGLLRQESQEQVFSALRFTESSDWMNKKLVPLYNGLTAGDFEQRNIEIVLLDQKWLQIAEKFLKKKYHNVSHLKELGIIFVIPLRIDTPGETLRVFSLLLHYLYEVVFYNKLIVKYSQESDFGQRLVSLLRGDVTEQKLTGQVGEQWRIVQRYLAKDDLHDPRLFEPHVNPETIHWDKAENSLTQLDVMYPGLEFTFWKDLNFIGDFFSNNGDQKLVSFNLIDSVMSLVKEKEMIKYLYHHQEALWNKILAEYIGQEKMEELMINNFAQGYIDLHQI
ncbi:hypothetical protein KJ903_04705 [Patescibacteria group bacterium]|nr:hypothetical protein [Patescibacteria group bacterium]